MAQIVTITNPLTGQPVQVDQLEHTAQQIDDGVNAAGIESTDYPGCIYRKLADGTIEWVNPPMLLDKEYRTTERYLGKPVYVRLHDFGALPNNTAKTDNSPANWSIDQAICAYGTTVAGTIPSQNFGGTLVAGRSISLYFNTGLIIVATDDDRSSLSATIFLKYTKTTD